MQLRMLIMFRTGLTALTPLTQTPLSFVPRAVTCVSSVAVTPVCGQRSLQKNDASRDIVLIDSGPVGGAASGRNGGFMDASLTHGISNGFRHFPDDIEVLEELGMKILMTSNLHSSDMELNATISETA